MGMRIHTAAAKTLAIALLDEAALVELYGEAFVGHGRCLVLQDTENLEALVLVGDLEALRAVGEDVVKLVRGRRPLFGRFRGHNLLRRSDG